MKRLLSLCFCLAIGIPSAARAQDVDDAVLRLAEPDFTLIGLPTNLRLPQFGSAFRVTHRFTRPLNDNFGDVAGGEEGARGADEDQLTDSFTHHSGSPDKAVGRAGARPMPAEFRTL